MNTAGAEGSVTLARRRVLLAAVVVGVFALGSGTGWLLHDFTAYSPERRDSQPAAVPPAPAGMPDRSAQAACEGFAALGAQWSSGYHQWYAAVSGAGEGWTWATPAVKAATDRFFPDQTRIALSLRALAQPPVPEPVGKAIGDYSAAVMTFAATQNTDLPSDELDARVARINTAADQVAAECTR